MLSTYTYPKYAYRTPPEMAVDAPPAQVPLVVVGAGPVGLSAAIDARLHGLPVILLDDDDTVSLGSRGVCYAKRALEILDRLGVGDRVVDKGVSWNVGRTFFRDDEVFSFNLLPVEGHKRPGMVNLQQYYLEQYLVERALEVGVDLRWKSRVVAIETRDDGVGVAIETPDGGYTLESDWLIAGDGARSPIRKQLGLEVEGKIFHDRFLIADVVMKGDFPAERWFWFDPPFHRNQSVLLHKQTDNVWRIDFQLGWDADPEAEKKPENVIPRVQAMLGADRAFELEWVSVYTFQCRRMHSFRHGRVLFVGDAAHQVSPFGARGANSGIQDADNLIWKLALVIGGQAPNTLLDSYDAERVVAADENLMNSTRSTDFITPKSATSHTFRDAVLALAGRHPFARALVNSGRLSVPAYLEDSPLNTPDATADGFVRGMVPGAPMEDAPVRPGDACGWLLDAVAGRGFVLLHFVDVDTPVDAAALAALRVGPIPVDAFLVSAAPRPAAAVTVLHDVDGIAAQRYDGRPGTTYLIRPDQHVAARWRRFDPAAVAAALARATAQA